jgi:hypothetical protein
LLKEALAKIPFPVILRERSDRRISDFQEVEILRFAQDDRRSNFAGGLKVLSSYPLSPQRGERVRVRGAEKTFGNG